MTIRFKRYIGDQETNKFYKTYKWKQKRKEVLKRDNYECQRCKERGKFSPGQCVHHIKELKFNPALAFANDNLITLCNRCHNDIHDKHFKNETSNSKSKMFEEKW